MAIELQVLDINERTVTVGFYYPVNSENKLTDSFESPPKGNLDQADLDLYNSGDLFEYIKELPFSAIKRNVDNLPELKDLLISLRDQYAKKALGYYREKYNKRRLTGLTYKDSNWSKN